MDKVEMTTEQQLAFDDFIDVMVQIDFKFPIYYDGKEGRAIRLLNETTVETVCLLTHN